MGTETEVKGHALLSYASSLQRQRPELWAKMEREFDAGTRAFYADPVYANVWYPRRHLVALLDAYDRVTGTSPAARRELGKLALGERPGAVILGL